MCLRMDMQENHRNIKNSGRPKKMDLFHSLCMETPLVKVHTHDKIFASQSLLPWQQTK